MQNRMRKHQLGENQVRNLLDKVEVGSLSTINEDGSPYVIPVHFVYLNNKIYIHGLPRGKKLDNIKNNSRVSFCVYEMQGLLLDPDEDPCDTNTKYESVVADGNSSILRDLKYKEEVLKEVIKKYTPHLTDKEMPENMLKGTAVIEVDIKNITGKYYG